MLSPFPGCALIRPISVSFALILLIAGCSSPASESPTSRETGRTLDQDGVQMLFPSAPGSSFRLGTGNPGATPQFVIEHGTPVTPGVEGGLHFWHLPSYQLTYASGDTGWTSRCHIRPGGNTEQLYTWQTQHGYLLNQNDLKNQECTVYIRVHGILDAPRAQVTLKIRGGAHTDKAPEQASCVMLTYSPASHGSITRFGKELTHPQYDYKTLAPAFSAVLQENVWVGLKLASWNDPHDPTRAIHRLYLDTDPFDAGIPRNGWRLFSEFVDIEGTKLTQAGQYTKLVDWGSWQTTLRTDGFESIDFAWPSAREIIPPQ
jgi:hypothetical protein